MASWVSPHGGLRQKDYTAYEEMIHIPMIFSNPALFPKPLETDAMAGLIDVLPTLMAVAGIRADSESQLQGQSLAPLFQHPGRAVQDRILFTYDDQLFTNQVQGAAHIRCIREHNWKFAMYFDPAGAHPTEYEMYDLKNDPLETTNLAHGSTPPAYQQERARLQAELTATMTKTGTLPANLCWRAKVTQSQGRRDEARAMLADIYSWFTEGFDTADLKDAKALLEELGA